MIENEVQNYDGQINLVPIEPQKIGQIANLPVESKSELTSRLGEVSREAIEARFARRRIVRRVKAGGIF